jgi:transketolase
MNEDLVKLVPQVRRDILRMVHAVNSGHPGGSLGCVEFFVTLYKRILEVENDSNLMVIYHLFTIVLLLEVVTLI